MSLVTRALFSTASRMRTRHTTGASHFNVTSNGGLVYVPSLPRRLGHVLVWVDREGHEEAINVPVREYLYPRISPDGTRVAVAIDVRNQENDVWIWESRT